MPCLYLTSQSLKRYVVHPNKEIERTDTLHNPSPRWTLQGLLGRKNKKGFYLSFEQINPETVKEFPPPYIVRDLDCGSTREWGEVIKYIYLFNTPQETPYYQYTRMSQSPSWKPWFVSRRQI